MNIKATKQFTLLLLFFSIFIFGNNLNGQTYFVIPHHGNTLKLQEKNDIKFEWGRINDKNNSQFKSHQQFQLGYAPMDFLGATIFHSSFRNRSMRGSEPNIHRSRHTGVEVGVFYKLKFNYDRNWSYTIRDTKQKGILGSFYTGYANGKLDNSYFGLYDDPITIDGEVEMNFHKFYIHSGIHWIGKKFEFSGLAKVGKINFSNGIISGIDYGRDFPIISAITQNNIYTFFDFTLKAEFNTAIFGFYAQSTTSKIKNLDKISTTKGDIGLSLIHISEPTRPY